MSTRDITEDSLANKTVTVPPRTRQPHLPRTAEANLIRSTAELGQLKSRQACRHTITAPRSRVPVQAAAVLEPAVQIGGEERGRKLVVPLVSPARFLRRRFLEHVDDQSPAAPGWESAKVTSSSSSRVGMVSRIGFYSASVKGYFSDKFGAYTAPDGADVTAGANGSGDGAGGCPAESHKNAKSRS
jgi:hypothetical protein